MKVMIYGKNIDVTPALKSYVEEKVKKLGKYFHEAVNNDAQEAYVSMEVERDRHIVEVTVYINGLILRGEEDSNDMYASIDGVIEKLERQVRKYKTRIKRRIKEKKREFKEGYKEERTEEVFKDMEKEEYEDEYRPKVVRTKRFAIKPMDVEEAIMQMDLLGHDFFVFTNAETNRVNVVYKRKRGDYGLIEPTF
ncbi:MAG: ribosome-associated translation inhibitor RaiA [Halanaerobiaceae bacterium]|nr:ribosome-associated translation inhibitor RaiA [Halanaerobiaceae bacterium]